MKFLLISAFSETGRESGANRLRKLCSGLRACGQEAVWLAPPVGGPPPGVLGKSGFSFWLFVRALRWARGNPDGWLLISLPPPWLLPLAFGLSFVTPKRLLLDFRDPLLNQEINPRPRCFRAVVGFMQREAIRRAHRVIVAAPLIAGRIGAPEEKSIAVLGGISEAEVRIGLSSGTARNPAVIVYGGTFYGSRSPRLLLESLAAYRGELAFDFLASFNEPGQKLETQALLDELGLHGKVRLEGQVPREEFIRRLRGAGGGLVITHSTGSDYAIPGKIFDYLTAGVVPWVISEDRGLLDFLERYNVKAVVTRGWTKEAILQGLAEFQGAVQRAPREKTGETLVPLYDSRQAAGLVAALAPDLERPR